MLLGFYGENEHQCKVVRGDRVKASRKLEMKRAMDVAETLNLDEQQLLHGSCEFRTGTYQMVLVSRSQPPLTRDTPTALALRTSKAVNCPF